MSRKKKHWKTTKYDYLLESHIKIYIRVVHLQNTTSMRGLNHASKVFRGQETDFKKEKASLETPVMGPTREWLNHLDGLPLNVCGCYSR